MIILKEKLNKIMLFGTFDGLHKGHLNFFSQARKLSLNSFLIISIARDKNVKRIKGQLPRLNERERINLIKQNKVADKVVLSPLSNYLNHILKEKPNIIALGYDQKEYTKNLKKLLKEKGLFVKIIRLKPFRKEIYKNHLLNKNK